MRAYLNNTVRIRPYAYEFEKQMGTYTYTIPFARRQTAVRLGYTMFDALYIIILIYWNIDLLNVCLSG